MKTLFIASLLLTAAVHGSEAPLLLRLDPIEGSVDFAMRASILRRDPPLEDKDIEKDARKAKASLAATPEGAHVALNNAIRAEATDAVLGLCAGDADRAFANVAIIPRLAQLAAVRNGSKLHHFARFDLGERALLFAGLRVDAKETLPLAPVLAVKGAEGYRISFIHQNSDLSALLSCASASEAPLRDDDVASLTATGVVFGQDLEALPTGGPAHATIYHRAVRYASPVGLLVYEGTDADLRYASELLIDAAAGGDLYKKRLVEGHGDDAAEADPFGWNLVEAEDVIVLARQDIAGTTGLVIKAGDIERIMWIWRDAGAIVGYSTLPPFITRRPDLAALYQTPRFLLAISGVEK